MDTKLVLKRLFDSYVNTQVDEVTTTIYSRMLQHVPPYELKMAVDCCICGFKFLPCVADILEVHRTLKGYEYNVHRSEILEYAPPEVLSYFEENIRLRSAQPRGSDEGIGGELRLLGLVE